MESGTTTDRGRGRDIRRILTGLASAAVIVGIFWGVLPRIADFSQVWKTIGAMTWLEISTLALASAWNLFTYWLVMIAVLPGLSLGRAAMANMSGAAVSNTLPGGGAIAVGLTYAMYSSWGFSPSQIALSVLVSGVWNDFIKLGLPVVAFALLALTGSTGTGLLTAALAGVAALAAAVALLGLGLWRKEFAYRVGSALGRAVSALRKPFNKPAVSHWGDSAVRIRDQAITLLARRWAMLTLASLLSHTALFLVLLLALRHVGVSENEVSWIHVLGAFAFMRLVTALPITPGGLGVAELSTTAALVLAGGDREQVVAAVLVYRALTFLPPIPIGALTYIAWRRSQSGRAHASRPAAVATGGPRSGP